jgi:ferredoxin
MLNKKGLRFSIRLLLLAGTLFMVLGGPLPHVARKLLPGLSPLSAISEAVAQRSWFGALYWMLPPLVLLLLAVFKGRLFCQWICPLGTLYGLPQKISLKKKILPFRLNALLFWTLVTSSICGISSLVFLDPLSTFSRLGAARDVAMWIPGALIPAFLLVSFFQPQAWCTHLCPLGYSFDLLNRKTGKIVLRRDRRQFLAGLGLGGATAAILPRIGTAKSAPSPSVLPPGATHQFAETCTRCYACVAACPSQIIKVKNGGPLVELAMPELKFGNEAACDESCNRCTEVCPTGAIRQLTLHEKQQTKIGEAVIDPSTCLAWANDEFCMVCLDVCPYSAIAEHIKDDVIPCPVMIPDLCRGCGACEAHCPATEAKAIVVEPICPQTRIA